MHTHRFVLLAALLISAPRLTAQESAKRWYLTDWRGFGNFNRTMSLPAGTTRLLSDAFVGDFSVGVSTKMLSFDGWDLGFTFQFQNLYGGFQGNRAKLYTTDYLIEIPSRVWISDKNFYVGVSLFHRSSHQTDKIEISTREEAVDLARMSIDIEDVNFIRFSVGQEMYGYAWYVGLQPWRLNYFFFAEGKSAFERRSYVPYTQRMYGGALFTLWSDGKHRVAFGNVGDFESKSRYITQLRYSTRLGKTPLHDGIQIYLAFEGGGGIQTNQILTTPYAGISAKRLFLGFAFSFPQ